MELILFAALVQTHWNKQPTETEPVSRVHTADAILGRVPG